MITENSNVFDGKNEQLKADGDNKKKCIKLVKAKISDAASDNEWEIERVLEASNAASPSYELHLDDSNKDEIKDSYHQTQKSSTTWICDTSKNEAENLQPKTQEPLTIQNDDDEIEECLSGTTNLSLEQLKKEGDPEGFPERSDYE